MLRNGDKYTLTYDDSDLPTHYAWKISARLEKLKARYSRILNRQDTAKDPLSVSDLEERARTIINALDDQGRWTSIYRGEALVGQPKFEFNVPYISSAVFARNIEILCEYLVRCKNQ